MTKKDIIEAALRVWGRDFYRKTSLSRLAVALKVSKPAIYRHFENKQALISAMTDYFFEDFGASVKADFEKALLMTEADEGIYLMIQGIAGYFARNVYSLLFALIKIYDLKTDEQTLSRRFRTQGADMLTLQRIIEKKYDIQATVMPLLYMTLIFFMSYFHKINNSFQKSPDSGQTRDIILTINKLIKNGFDFPAEKINAIDFEELEKQVRGMRLDMELDPMFRAVAETVAEAGPWEASMDMVAKRVGLSKSSLYCHFRNKKDMLRKLFMSEFRRIIEFARDGIKMSDNAAEQLYLGIFAIAVYLRSRPEILVALGWIRTRKLDLGKPDKNLEIFRLFEDIEIETARKWDKEEKQRSSHWILFLLINTLTRPFLSNRDWQAASLKNNQNDDIRILYKLITLGLGGFTR